MAGDSPTWSNPSVLAFAGGADPLAKARAVAAQLAQVARDHNLQGPPVDVLGLARALGISMRPVNEVADARIGAGQAREDLSLLSEDPAQSPAEADVFPGGTAGLTIDYNPSRPRGRLRFSIAHELAHACFADVADQVRHRTGTGAVAEVDDGDNWELELLCNVIAAELLIPDEAVEGLLNIPTDIDFAMETRRRWDVSTEALLRRLVTAVPRPMTMIATSRVARYGQPVVRVDYADVSAATDADSPLRGLRHGDVLSDAQVFLDCVAVGQTVRGQISIGGQVFTAQCVGAPAYPGSRFPRVLALLEKPDQPGSHPGIEYVTGDLLELGDGDHPVVIGHVVSDSVHGWGRFGVGAALAAALPDAARAFRAWTIADPDHLKLGNVHFLDQYLGGRPVQVASMVAQHGFGRGQAVRLRYDALERCLQTLARRAERDEASVHIPRIGAGQAGGRWDIIADLVDAHLVSRGIAVTVHTRPAPPARSGGLR